MKKILARGYYYNFGVVAGVVVVGRGDVDDDGSRGDNGGDNVGFIKLP